MIETLGVAEAKRRFSELLNRVAAGGKVVIARRGRPTVAMIPAESVGEDRPDSIGFAAFAGALSDWDEIDAVVDAIYAARRGAKDRPPPTFD